MRFRWFVCVLVIAGFGPPPAAAWVRAKFFESRFVSYLHADPAADGNALMEGRLAFEGRREMARGVEMFVAPEVVGDQRSLSAGILSQVHDRMARRPNVNVAEAYLDVYGKQVDLRIGKQKISWGNAVGLNPTDVFGAFDYADLLDPQRLGQVGFRGYWYPKRAGVSSVEFVFLPVYSPSRAGRVNTRWRTLLDGTVPVPLDVRFPANTAANAGYGLRLALPLSGWDVSASYARVVDDVAGGARAGGLFVTPLFLNKRTVGLDAARLVDEGRWEVHVEAAYTSTPSGYDDDYLLAVAGGRRSYTDFYKTWDLDLTLEWSGEHVYSTRRSPGTILQTLVQRPAPGSVLADARIDLSEFTSLRIAGVYTSRGPDAFLVSTELAWKATDLLELRAGFDALSGDGGGTNASSYEENDRWRLEATIHFAPPGK
ncbi:hypothetical protein HY522_10660 [bacterium]|nr:hypothetical protein [bacterium]